MQRHPPTLLWSPHEPEVFAIGMSDQLRLYEFQHGEGGSGSTAADEEAADDASGGVYGERAQSMQLISSLGDVHQLRCAAWSPRADDPWVLAVGTASGKVVLHDCTPAKSQGRAAPTSAQREFVPHSQRSCFSLAWNHVHTSQIAAGLDKVRRDYGILVWDLQAQRPTARVAPGGDARAGGNEARISGQRSGPSSLSFDISAVGAIESVDAPFASLGNTDAAVAVAWLPSNPCGLLVGTAFRWLRLYDLRTREEQLACHAHPKAVFGVSFDPFDAHRLLTFSEEPAGVVKGWDVRKLADHTPLFTLPMAALGGDARAGHTAPSRAGPKGLLQVRPCALSVAEARGPGLCALRALCLRFPCRLCLSPVLVA